MGYRLAEEREHSYRDHYSHHHNAKFIDYAKPSVITVNNGTIVRMSIPCFYGRPFSQYDRMVMDHLGWPEPGMRDCSHYAQVFAINEIDLASEGYDQVIVSMNDRPEGLTITGEIDRNSVVLTIVSLCPNVSEEDVDVDFAVYVIGNYSDNDGHSFQLRDLVTKGILHVIAGPIR